MKKHYIVCYEAGTNGNFVASLIRTMADANYYRRHGQLTSHGSCDHMSGGQRLIYDYPLAVFGRSIYPENEKNVKIITDALDNPIDTYEKFLMPHEQQFPFNLTTIHFRQARSISKFLENNWVIYITYDLDDLALIATNHVYKVIESERDRPDEKINVFKTNLKLFNFDSSIKELDQLENLSDISNAVLRDLITVQMSFLKLPHRFLNQIDDHDRLLKLPFKLMYTDPTAVMSMLSNFINYQVNESTELLYKDYMAAQKKTIDIAGTIINE